MNDLDFSEYYDLNFDPILVDGKKYTKKAGRVLQKYNDIIKDYVGKHLLREVIGSSVDVINKNGRCCYDTEISFYSESTGAWAVIEYVNGKFKRKSGTRWLVADLVKEIIIPFSKICGEVDIKLNFEITSLADFGI